jgi:hypothetical protein
MSAAWRSPFLRKLIVEIGEDRFRKRLNDTIGFLSKFSSISPTCRDDCNALRKIQQFLFGGPPDEAVEWKIK